MRAGRHMADGSKLLTGIDRTCSRVSRWAAPMPPTCGLKTVEPRMNRAFDFHGRPDAIVIAANYGAD